LRAKITRCVAISERAAALLHRESCALEHVAIVS
jgi:hypothetical protein